MQTNYVGEIADRQTDSGERRGRVNCSSRQTSVRPHVLIKRIHLTLLTARAAEKFEPLRGVEEGKEIHAACATVPQFVGQLDSACSAC